MATRKTSGGGVHSQAQWRWAFATHKSFARKWADKVVATRGKKIGYHSLPVRKGRPTSTTVKKLK